MKGRVLSLTTSGHLLHPSALWEELGSWMALGGHREAADERYEVCASCWCLWRPLPRLPFEQERTEKSGLGQAANILYAKTKREAQGGGVSVVQPICCQVPFCISNQSVQAISLKIKMGSTLVYANEYANRQVWGSFNFKSLNQMRSDSTLHRGSKTELEQLILHQKASLMSLIAHSCGYI